MFCRHFCFDFIIFGVSKHEAKASHCIERTQPTCQALSPWAQRNASVLPYVKTKTTVRKRRIAKRRGYKAWRQKNGYSGTSSTRAHGDSILRKHDSLFIMNFTHLRTLFHSFLLYTQQYSCNVKTNDLRLEKECQSRLDQEVPRSANVNNGWNDGRSLPTWGKREGKDRQGRDRKGLRLHRFWACHFFPFPLTPEKLFYTWHLWISKCRKERGVRKHDTFCIKLLLSCVCLPA